MKQGYGNRLTQRWRRIGSYKAAEEEKTLRCAFFHVIGWFASPLVAAQAVRVGYFLYAFGSKHGNRAYYENCPHLREETLHRLDLM